jgi:hypothetical protein
MSFSLYINSRSATPPRATESTLVSAVASPRSPFGSGMCVGWADESDGTVETKAL